jgi:hypothetical protein
MKPDHLRHLPVIVVGRNHMVTVRLRIEQLLPGIGPAQDYQGE